MKKFIVYLIACLSLSGCYSNSSSSSLTTNTSSDTQTSSTSIEKVPTIISVTLDKHKLSLKPGDTYTLTPIVKGENNPDLSVQWSSSDESIAKVDDGKVSILTSAKEGSEVTITVNSLVDISKSDSCVINIKNINKYTLFMYICGSTLEYDPSDGIIGAASDDISEILSVDNQPDDVDIVIETGGTQRWSPKHNINASKLERFHVSNKKLVKDSSINKANMGASSTLESFLTWGIETYPAEKYGLVLWNHGGAVSGVCFDSNYNSDSLTTSEVAKAMKNSFQSTGIERFEWIGYDACIMNYADNASIMSDYCNYLVGSQELENGDGWDYAAWLPTLYNDPTIDSTILLDKICQTFVEQYGSGRSNDQCLSVIDLNKFKDFTVEFNQYTKAMSSNTDFENICSSLSKCDLTFGEDCYGLGDMVYFLNRLDKIYTSLDSSNVRDALTKSIVSNHFGGKYSNRKPCGTNVFVATSLDYYYPLQCVKSSYTTNDSKFTTWRTLNYNYGDWFTY